MTTYIIAILSLICLCAFWALLQNWLSNHDPDPNSKDANPANCQGCETQCGKQN